MDKRKNKVLYPIAKLGQGFFDWDMYILWNMSK